MVKVKTKIVSDKSAGVNRNLSGSALPDEQRGEKAIP